MKKYLLVFICAVGFSGVAQATFEPTLISQSIAEKALRELNKKQTNVTSQFTDISGNISGSLKNYVTQYKAPELKSSTVVSDTLNYLPEGVANEVQNPTADSAAQMTQYYSNTLLVRAGTPEELAVTNENQKNNAYIVAARSVAVGVEGQVNAAEGIQEAKDAAKAVADENDFTKMNKQLAVMTMQSNEKIQQSKILQAQLLELNAADTLMGSQAEDMSIPTEYNFGATTEEGSPS